MTSVYEVSLKQMEAFAELGYIVLPQVIPPPIIVVATRAIEDLKQREPPPPKGNHAYWLEVTPPDQFLSLLLDTSARLPIRSFFWRSGH